MIFICLLLLSTQITAAEKTHFTIAIDPEYIPFTQKDIEGNPTGLLVDFWNHWAKQNHYTVEYKFYKWEETLEATKKGEVDFHSGTTKDRDWMYASDKIYEIATSLFTLRNSKISNIRSLQHKRVGAIDAYYGQLVKDAIGNSIDVITYDDYPPLVEALKRGEIDALIDDVESVVYYFIKTGQMNRFKQIKDKRLHFYNDVYAICNAENKPLLKQINAGLKKMSLKKLAQIEKIWLPTVENAFYTKKLQVHSQYTSEEEKWLQKNSISLTGDPQWLPTLLGNGVYHYRGIMGDYLRVITSNMGSKLKIHPANSWEKILHPANGRYSDVIFGSMDKETKNRLSQKYDFLEAQDFGPMVIVMNKKVRFITDLYDIRTKKIGILSSQEYTDRICSKYVSYDFVKMKTVPALLDAIKNGKIDAGLLSLSKAIDFLVKKKYEALDIVGKTDESIYVDTGILKEKPILKDIIRKSLISLNTDTKEEILSKWTRHLNYIEKVDYKLTYSVASLLGLLLLSTGYYAYAIRRKHEAVQRMNVKIEHLLKTDDLTGLYNKRAFTQAFERIDNEKKISGLLFIDVDYFKKYNDFYGHMQGDDALEKIGEQLNSYTSWHREAYRIGGEEFGIVLYDCSEGDALRLAEKVRADMEALDIVHAQSPYGHITLSVGIAMSEEVCDTKSLYINADEALYKAKMAGRNTVVLYDSKEKPEMT
ncbi:GGDEF domain-containing protein [Sulfurovum sp.]|uniref:transporter substrate-binding domain-containing diguanylate cyclase n=1 Tax=Sulfurovum sp. TaxID=1969726 RepID=UPI0025E2BBE5|nr:GGDEF domain-containing protein [Sulfurovum sp.]